MSRRRFIDVDQPQLGIDHPDASDPSLEVFHHFPPLGLGPIGGAGHLDGQVGNDVTRIGVGGSAKGLVRRRDEDGRYAVVRTDVALDVELEPKPLRTDLAAILEWAERGCFIGSSLTAKPTYHWNVT